MLLAAGCAMADAEVEYEDAQPMDIVEQTVVLETIQDKAYVEASLQFTREKHALTEALFVKLDAKEEVEEGPEIPQLQELPHLPVYWAPGTETIVISNNEFF